MKTRKERLQDYAALKHMSANKVEKILGLSNGSMSKQSDDLSYNVIGKAAQEFRDLNIDWLLFGDGSMYKNSAAGDGSMQNVSGSHNSVGIPAKKFESEDKWFELVAQKDAQIERMQAQIDKLLSMIR